MQCPLCGLFAGPSTPGGVIACPEHGGRPFLELIRLSHLLDLDEHNASVLGQDKPAAGVLCPVCRAPNGVGYEMVYHCDHLGHRPRTDRLLERCVLCRKCGHKSVKLMRKETDANPPQP